MQAERTYIVKTLGCKANLYDSQLIEAELQKRGWKPGDDSADLCIVNSCTVTDEADRQSRKLASRMGRLNPASRIVITGCAAEVDPESMAATQGVDYVIGNRDKPRLVDLILEKFDSGPRPARADASILGIAEGYDQMLSRHPVEREWPLTDSGFLSPLDGEGGASERTRAFLKIQDGCNSFCTYCVIPYGRGPARSLSIDEVVDRVKSLVDRGVREVVITGINIGDYGVDWTEKPQVERMVEAVLGRTSLERLRISSLDPVEISPDLTNLVVSERRLLPHFHVSLQSPHSRILRLMKRKYRSEEVEECLQRIADLPAPAGGPFVGMDVITGFPGETDQEFEWGLDTLSRLPWSRLHVFPYSERAGTPATRLPGAVPKPERQRRAKALRDLSLNRLEKLYQRTLLECRERGRVLDGILVEGRVRGPGANRIWLAGYTENYLRVIFDSGETDPSRATERYSNQILSARPTDVLVDRQAGDAAFLVETDYLSR